MTSGRVREAKAAPDLATIARAVTDFVPFNRHLGVQVVELSGKHAVATLPASDDLGNHVGTVHAAALFLVAETAAGAAFASAFAASLGDLRFVMRHAEADFLRPARGAVSAVADVPCDPEAVLAAIAAEGKAVVEVMATAADQDGETVASLRASYHVSAAKAKTAADRA